MVNHEKLLWEASKVWCPDVTEEFPRHASNRVSFQERVDNRSDLVTGLLNAAEGGKPGFVSTYSFPRGHTEDGKNIPQVNTIFVDFDIPPESEYRRKEDNPLNAWKRSMSALLVRVRMIADALLETGLATHWRASLSGHKGIHLFLDFEEVAPENGTYSQFVNGLSEYGQSVIDGLDEVAGGISIDGWLDVDSSDLARMVRHPNTPHHGAKHIDEVSWCVPVSIEELSQIDPEMYLDLASSPRELPAGCERDPSERAKDKVSTKIRNASGKSYSNTNASVADTAALETYKKKSNDKISVSDLPFLTTNKPCIMEFVSRKDAFEHGSESRTMEINVIKELTNDENRVPIDVIVDFFRPIDGYSEEKTRSTVEDIVSRNYGPFVCQNIMDEGGNFCVADNSDYDETCHIYERGFEN